MLLGLLDELLQFLQFLKALVPQLMRALLDELKLKILDAVTIEVVGYLGRTVDHIGEFIDLQKLVILGQAVRTCVVAKVPRYRPSLIFVH